MPSIETLLDQLEDAKRRFDHRAQAEKLISTLGQKRFPRVESLIRFHEMLLFIRAHPHSPQVLRLTEALLSSFATRVEMLRRSGADLTPFDYIEYSGIAGTVLSGTFSYGIARWLAHRYKDQVEINWERYEKKERLALVLPRVLPLFYEDSLVEANVPYQTWLGEAMGQKRGALKWLIERVERLPISDREKSHLYDSLELPIRWEMGDERASRTNNRTTPSQVFYHTGPLIQRREVSLEKEIDSPSLPLQKLSIREGEAILDRVKETTAVRYRELYGITYGDPRNVVRSDIGRGTEVFLWGLAPERRLPLRAYHAGLTLKNGVPINYIEGITICERMEVGFNTFYTYREGETAWVYARVLKLLGQTAGATCFSLDSYQLGHNNDEALESGAFWFYRKLGFRPTRPDLLRLTEKEEKKIAAIPGYRTPIRTLRKLAAAPAIYEHHSAARGEWDRFQIRNLGFAVQRSMANRFDGDASRMRAAATREASRALGIDSSDLNPSERAAFEDFSFVLSLVPDLAEWTDKEKQTVIRIIRAKAGRDESRYARLLQQHSRLRREIIRLGSQPMLFL